MPARILIVEDNAANLELARYLLEASGYTILTAEDGEEGLRIALMACPDLIVSDLQMPVLDGYQLLEALRKEALAERIPVIAVTALSMAGDRSKVLHAGFDGYLSKPIVPETFVCQVEAFLPPELRIVPTTDGQ